MPGPQAPGQTLVVVVELETAERWVLQKARLDASATILSLDLSEGGAGYPGSAGYRSGAAGSPARIEILCNDKLHYMISEVLSVS